MDNLKLRIVTPNGELYNDNASMVIIRSSVGDLGILKGHQPLTTTLDYGILKVKQGGKDLVSTIFGGFADVQPDCVTILTDSAEWIDDIDLARAKEAKARAEERIKGNDQNLDLIRAELALKRAMIRINAKE